MGDHELALLQLKSPSERGWQQERQCVWDNLNRRRGEPRMLSIDLDMRARLRKVQLPRAMDANPWQQLVLAQHNAAHI